MVEERIEIYTVNLPWYGMAWNGMALHGMVW